MITHAHTHTHMQPVHSHRHKHCPLLEEVEIVFLSLIIEERFHILVVRMTRDDVKKMIKK